MNPTLISFSGGRSSAYMAKRLIDNGISNYVVLFANTGKEAPATLDFVNECDKRWSLNVVWLEYTKEKPWFKVVTYETASRNGEPFEKIFRNYLPNIAKRFCTAELKVKVMKRYMKSIGVKKWDVAMGIRYDEPLRWGRYLLNAQKEPFFYTLPLYEWRIIKSDITAFWKASDFDLQIISDAGNCDLCFMKGRAKMLRLIRADPSKADWWIEQEKKMKSTFIKNTSYLELKQMAITQTEIIFEKDEIEFPCHCTID